MKALLDNEGVEFFRKSLVEDTESQIRLLESSRNIEGKLEFGRVRLYEERSIIERHFNRSLNDRGLFLQTDPSYALVLMVKSGNHSSLLTWRELEGLRHSMAGLVRADLEWKNEQPPNARLTEGGKVTKKVEIL